MARQTQLDEGSDTSGSLVQGNGGATIDVALTVNAALAQQTFLSTLAGISQEQAAAYLGSARSRSQRRDQSQ